MPPLISIIVPVYNVENMLKRCVDSIKAQTCSDFELILIDDGSQDKSGEICDAYEKTDKRIMVIHQSNKGSSGARNKGLSVAQGTYLVFIDSDDWVEPNHLQNMLDCLLASHAEMVISAFYLESFKKGWKVRKNKPSKLDAPTILNEYFTNKLHAGLSNKMVLRELFVKNNITFPKYNFYEDMVVSTQLTIVASSIVYCEHPSYRYAYNSSSMTHDMDENKRYEMFQDFIHNMKFIQDLPYIKSRAELKKAIIFLINYNKKGLVVHTTNQQLLDKTMEMSPDSITLRNIQKFSDLLLYLSYKFHFYTPLRLYLKTRILIFKKG